MRVLFLSLVLTACSGSPFAYRSPGPYEGGALVGTGSYFAEVWLKPAPRAEELRFNAVFARRPDSTIFNAVTAGGKPLFRVRDRMTASETPEVRAFPSELPLDAATLTAFYRALRPVVVLDDAPAKAPAWVKERHSDGRPRRLSAEEGLSARIDEYDWDGHAFRLELEGNGWSARVALREYDVAR